MLLQINVFLMCYDIQNSLTTRNGQKKTYIKTIAFDTFDTQGL